MFRLPLLLLPCLLASSSPTGDDSPKPSSATVVDTRPTTLEDVRFIRENQRESREMRCGTCALSHRQKVYELGDKRLIAACEVMLAAPTDAEEVASAFWILSCAKGDRSRFIKPAVAALRAADRGIRWSAAELLGEIGSPKEGPALIASLTDGSADVVNAAAKSLAAIGGPTDLVAMDTWLGGTGPDMNGNVPRRPDFREEVAKYRNAMAARLAKERAKGDR